ncbi:class I lanthipeptide [Kordia algicida]|uniref:class I lanthipeptide n=1 Tax=Kordia algicida TaxID=221066 RepID=UPI001872ADB3
MKKKISKLSLQKSKVSRLNEKFKNDINGGARPSHFFCSIGKNCGSESCKFSVCIPF